MTGYGLLEHTVQDTTKHKATRSAETRLAELLARARVAGIQHWNARQARDLACAIVVAGDTFHVRRVLQRLERGELDVVAATQSIVRAWLDGMCASVGAARRALG